MFTQPLRRPHVYARILSPFGPKQLELALSSPDLSSKLHMACPNSPHMSNKHCVKNRTFDLSSPSRTSSSVCSSPFGITILFRAQAQSLSSILDPSSPHLTSDLLAIPIRSAFKTYSKHGHFLSWTQLLFQSTLPSSLPR